VTEAYSRARATSARASDSGGGVDLSEEEGFLGELGLLGEWTVYSAQVIRQVRILPDRLWARA
jgi:hypothetical protein